ncbi:hypothetical protein RugamoR57_07760 [Duganella caerulea]|uniref:EAL domain-containing protein n=1 Tax=Duganella caerulea TaxID=2885762 RepID=UPI0030E8ED3A
MNAYTIRKSLLAMVAVQVLTASAAGTALSCYAGLAERRLLAAQAQQAARSLQLDLDAEFDAYRSLASALAAAPALRQHDWRAFQQQAQWALRHSKADNLTLITVAGQPLVDTQRPFGADLPGPPEPAVLARAAAGERPVISDLYLGAAGAAHTMSVCVPVWEDRRLAYFINVGVAATRFSAMLAARGLPPGWRVTLLDGRGTVVARNGDDRAWVGKKAAPALLRALGDQGASAPATIANGDAQVYQFGARSPASGWRVGIGVPVADMWARLWVMLGLTLGAAILLAGLGAWQAGARGQALRRALDELRALARALATGRASTTRPLELAEARRVARALAQVGLKMDSIAQAQRAAEAALHRARADLEAQLRSRAAELKQSRHLLAAIIEYMPAMVFVKRAGDLRYQMLNRAGELLLGMPRAQVVQMNDIDLLGTEQGQQRMAAERRALASEQVVEIDEEPIRLPSGAIRSLRTHRCALRDANGKPSYLLGISLDITDSQHAAEQLRIAAVAFESQEAMLITDSHNVIIRVNLAFSASSGYDASEVLGRTPKMLQAGRHDEAFYADMWHTIHQRGAWQGELWVRRKSNEVYPAWTTISAIRDPQGRICHYVWAQTDISARKKAEEEIRQLAFFDPLTRLPNRRLLLDRLRHVIGNARRNGKFSALMFIDLDNFKLLNDTLGHDQGDRLLQQVAERLPACVRAGDTVARLGGDEFVVVLEELDTDSQAAALHAQAVGEDILAELNRPYQLAGRSCRCSPSIGITMFSDHNVSVDDLLKRADLAMYQAKKHGRNTARFFEENMQVAVDTRVQLEHELHEALSHGQFELYYQAQVDHANQVTGAEALLRWIHPQRGIVEPEQFIGLAEDTGFIVPLGRWVLQQACAQLSTWRGLPVLGGLSVAVNISSRQFLQADFVEQVLRTVERSGADPCKLKLELTESMLLKDVTGVIAKMETLRRHGISLSLDDFGTGYSSLSYLKRLPLDQLKIDRSLACDLQSDPDDAAIARIILTLGQSLGLSIVAEGVETEAQRHFLAALDCRLYQGYLFSRPLPEQAFRRFVHATLAPAP